MEWTDFISPAAALVALLAAGAVLFRVEGSAAGKLFAIGMLLLGGEAVINFVSSRQVTLDATLHWQELRYVPLSMLPGTWIAFSLAYSRGDYRDQLRSKLVLIIVSLAAPILTLAVNSHRLLQGNPIDSTIRFQLGAQLLEFILIAAAIVVLMNLEQTFRSSVGTQRWKIKLVMVGIGGLFIVRIYSSCQLVIGSTPSESMASLNSGMLIISCLLVGFSVVRTKDFSIDLYPSQTALHRSVLVIIIGIYLVVVGLLSKLASFLGGNTDFQLRALVILVGLVGFALLLMSDRLRERSRAWINRHFSRPHYNYQQVWSSFTRDTATISNTEELCPALAKWISRTLNALSVTVWLFDRDRTLLKPVGSTLGPDQTLPDSTSHDSGTWAVIVQSAVHLKKIVNLDHEQVSPVEKCLTRIHPRVFPNGGDRLAVPLIAGDENLGIVLIGDRINGIPFTSEDEELLTTIAEQASLEIQAIRLSAELMQAHQMEAFQNMSTFFVHDLKNTASSLSLMLQNLPRHFDNPEFREDALRSIEKSVARINQMIQSLSALRRKLVIEPSQIDLAVALPSKANALEKDRDLNLICDYRSAGLVNADVQQINRVLTNLLVNAQEASSPDQPIKLSTGRHDGFAFLEVSDEGEGMTEDYVQHQLFQPFKTTKKQGTGIGLYHSKMIVDAHRGRVEVQSQPGVGTTIRILLPLLVSSDEAQSIDRR